MGLNGGFVCLCDFVVCLFGFCGSCFDFGFDALLCCGVLLALVLSWG